MILNMTTMNIHCRCATLLLLLPPSAQATAVINESIEQMARRCPVVVRGTVERQKTQWDARHQNIETLTTIRVTDGIKGRVKSKVTVRTLGGEVDGIGQRIVGSPVFRTGGEVFVFIENVRN
jgi:hypothetical protein